MRILEVLIFIIALVILYKLTAYFTRRIRGILRIKSLRKGCGLTVKFLRSPILSFFRVGASPDIAVEIGDDIYLLRIINGKGASRHLHFASKSFYVTFSSMRITLGALLNVGRKYKVTKGSGYQTTSNHSVKILKELDIPEEYKIKNEFDNRKIIPVLLLNPAPQEVNYVTEERTSIKAAFEGDMVYGQRIFTASTFEIFADRAKREKELTSRDRAIFSE